MDINEKSQNFEESENDNKEERNGIEQTSAASTSEKTKKEEKQASKSVISIDEEYLSKLKSVAKHQTIGFGYALSIFMILTQGFGFHLTKEECGKVVLFQNIDAEEKEAKYQKILDGLRNDIVDTESDMELAWRRDMLKSQLMALQQVVKYQDLNKAEKEIIEALEKLQK